MGVKLNGAAYDFAKRTIQQGHAVRDARGR
jgi:hypothetical protein